MRSVSVLLLLLIACGTPPPGPGIDVDRAMAFMTEIAKPRPAGHTRETVTAIERELRAIGLSYEEQVPGVVTIPAIDALGVHVRDASTRELADPNILVRFGEGRALLVMAHYDSMPDSPGACDNAASVAILVELARVLHDHWPQEPVILAFTAGEEEGLVGSESLVGKLDVDFAISLDLVGGDGPLVLNGASKLIGKTELAWLRDAADAAGVDLDPSLGHRLVSRTIPQGERSDHGPFTMHGIRAVHFYNRGNDGEWFDAAYHSERDRPSRVHRESVAAVGRLLRALAMSRVPEHDGDGVWMFGFVIPRWLLIALEVLLALTTLSLFRQTGPREPGAGLLLGAASYVVATIIAILVVDQPRWILDPLRFEIASLLVLVGALGLVGRIIGRFKPWTGAHRYRVLATLVCLAIGLVILLIGGAEIAWIWLVAAAAIATLPAPLALAGSLLPAVVTLQPMLLRELAWNGFLPSSLPIPLLVSVLVVPVIATTAWILRRRHTHTGPLGALVLPVGSGLLLIGGLVVAVTPPLPCSAAEFEQFSLACDRV